MSETYECVCIVFHRKFQSRREYARLCSGRCKSELGNLRRQGIEALDRGIDRGALRSNAVAIESQRISPRRIVDGVLLPTTAADATHMQLIE